MVRLFELWDSEEALVEHFSSAHMARWQQTASSLPLRGRDIVKYTIADHGPLS